VDIWEILKDPKWVQAFKKAFSHVEKTGETNSIITSFKMIYIALVIAFESTGLKMLSFEYDIHTGINPEQSVLNIMKAHSSFMKSVIFPVIKIICVCKNVSNPLDTVNNLIKDENTAKEAQKKAKEGGYPYKSEENGLSCVESHRAEMLDRYVMKRSGESAGIVSLIGLIASFFSSGAAGAGATLLAPIIIFTVIIILLIISVPLARLIIYWANVKKVDLQKELEMQAELLNNNILQLEEKLQKASSEEERVRLQNIINKQIEMLVSLQGKIKQYLDEEYEAAVEASKEAESDDSSINAGDNDGGNDGGFEVSI
jgi:hypothetical protein